MGAAILGTGRQLARIRVNNPDLVARGVDASPDWILSRTGIQTRYWASAGESTSDLAAAAAVSALEQAALSISDVRLLICATSSPDFSIPSTASVVLHKLGGRCGGFDVNGVCSGFVHALVTGFALCEQSSEGAILVVAADTYSRLIDLKDRRTATFFGDAAGAAVIGRSSSQSWLRSARSGSAGEHFDKIILPMGGSRCPVSAAGLAAGDGFLKMDGKAVKAFAVECVPRAVRAVVEKAGLTLADIDLIVPHQANLRILEHCMAELAVGPERWSINVDRLGNTAAASVAVALDEAASERRLSPGQNVVLVGFGGGFSWSAACLRWGSLDAEEVGT